MSDTVEVFISLALLLLLYCVGWVSSASTIALECEKLGAFYVGSTVYKCEVKP